MKAWGLLTCFTDPLRSKLRIAALELRARSSPCVFSPLNMTLRRGGHILHLFFLLSTGWLSLRVGSPCARQHREKGLLLPVYAVTVAHGIETKTKCSGMGHQARSLGPNRKVIPSPGTGGALCGSRTAKKLNFVWQSWLGLELCWLQLELCQWQILVMPVTPD